MKRFFFFGSIIIGLISLFTSCNNPAQNSQSPSNASVWEISKNGNSLFLGGSVHILRIEDYPMPAAFDSAFDKSMVLVLEADVDKMSDAEIVQYQKDKLMLPEGQTLQTVLDYGVYRRLEDTVGGPDVINAISQYKPAMAVNIVQTVLLQQNKFTNAGADLYYLVKAKGARKSIDFLEDIKLQIDILGSMADGYENEYISTSLDELPQYVNGVIALISEWKSGTETIIEASLSMQEIEWPAIYKTMVYDRNMAWIEKIEQYLTTQEIEFIIVGLAHLHGHDGLLIQLKNKGYTIKQLIN